MKINSVAIEHIVDVLKHWGISGETVEYIYTSEHNSSWNIGGRFVLQRQLVHDAQHQSRKIRLATILAKEGIATVVYLKTTQGDLATPDGAYTLMEMLKGEHIDFYASPDLMCELGRGLAELHLALSKLESELQCRDNDFYAEWENYIKPGLIGVSYEIIEQAEAKISAVYEKLPRCPIHRDIHAQNVLFHNGKISGWLDFELSRKDARIFDIAYLLVGLLVGHTKDSAKLDIWKTIYRNLLEGYNEINRLTDDEISVLPDLMIAIELLFVTYWNGVGNNSGRDEANELAEWLFHNKV
ncbi:MAG: phosphotransferase [Defluviitaleaceae bacterium]|nr:phosphotransferase [Defluviitaleaceae bacterium]